MAHKKGLLIHDQNIQVLYLNYQNLDVFDKAEAERLSARNMKLIKEIAERTERIEQLVDDLTEARRVANRIYNIHERAMSYHDTVCPKKMPSVMRSTILR